MKLIQIKLPIELFEQIEVDRKGALLSKSAWFMLAAQEKLSKGSKVGKKVIEL